MAPQQVAVLGVVLKTTGPHPRLAERLGIATDRTSSSSTSGQSGSARRASLVSLSSGVSRSRS